RQRGGLMPDEARRLEVDEQREAALGAISSDGDALFDDVEGQSGILKAQARDAQRELLKREARRARKRWGGSNAAEPEHKYSTATFKISPRKLQLLASQIGGKPIDLAILQMQFSAKRAAKRVQSTLALARDHAAEKGMDVKRLVVSEAWVGKGRYIARADIKGRARMGTKHHPSARLSIVLRYGKTWEQKEYETIQAAVRKVRSLGTGGIARVQRPIVNVHQRPGWNI
ncbi:ribosomal protein L22, partial [Tilletiaria anomala UBC 951]